MYQNDDFFFLSSLRTSDFYTNGQFIPSLLNSPYPSRPANMTIFTFPIPSRISTPPLTTKLKSNQILRTAYGPVLRLQPNLLVAPHRDGLYASGEWQALQRTNGLLSAFTSFLSLYSSSPSLLLYLCRLLLHADVHTRTPIGDRFAARYRPYAVHQSRTFTRSLVSELSLLWASDLALTSKRPFRGMSGGAGGGDGEVYVGFLYGGYLIERYREHLLWSWMVGKIGTSITSDDSKNNKWTLAHARAAWSDLGGSLSDTLGKTKEDDVLKVARADGQREKRTTLDPERVGKVVSDEEGILVRVGPGVQGMKTRYMFCEFSFFAMLSFFVKVYPLLTRGCNYFENRESATSLGRRIPAPQLRASRNSDLGARGLRRAFGEGCL